MAYDASPPVEVTARDRVIQLRDFLETLPPERFDIESYFSNADGDPILSEEYHTCGSAACIAGWAILKFGDPLTADWYQGDAGSILGLSAVQAKALFTPDGLDKRIHTAPRAVRVLDNYLSTGLIDWSCTALEPQSPEVSR